MSEGGFHVHGPHDHAVEHGAQGGDSLAGRIAVMTAVLSTVGAVVGYQGGHTQNEAMLFKNEAVLKKTEASNQWAFYQAKSNKQNLAELAAAIAPSEKQDFYKTEIDRYKQEKSEIKATAEKLEAESTAANDKSEAALHPHERLAQALTMVQVGISLASITVLTRKKWLFAAAGVASAAGIGLWIAALLTH